MTIENIFCTACGTANQPDARFCYKCGSPIRGSIPAAPPPLITTPSAAPVTPPAFSSSPAGDFITLACPTCGGKLTITADLERFACQFCGNEHIVRRSGGTISLEPVMQMMHTINNNINNMSSGLDFMKSISEKQAAEMAIKRLNKEIEDLQKQSASLESGSNSSWLIFGISAVVTFVSILALSLAGDERIIKVFFVPSATIGGFMTVIGLIVVISVSSSRRKRERQLAAQISQKIQDLNRNQQIVNS